MARQYVTGPADLTGRLHIDAGVGIVELNYLGVVSAGIVDAFRFKNIHAQLSEFTPFFDVEAGELATTIFRLEGKV